MASQFIIKKVLLALTICLFSCSSVKKTTTTNSVVSSLEITFQNFFDKDTVRLKINDCTIIGETEITSNRILGITDLSIKLTKSNKITIKKKEVTLPCSITSTDILTLKATLNNQEESIYTINQKDGKYIGFNKIEGKLKITQSKTPFEYD